MSGYISLNRGVLIGGHYHKWRSITLSSGIFFKNGIVCHEWTGITITYFRTRCILLNGMF